MYVRPLNENEDVKSSTREFKFLNKLGESKRHELMGLAVRGSFMTVKRSHNPMTTRRGGGEPAFFCGIAETGTWRSVNLSFPDRFHASTRRSLQASSCVPGQTSQPPAPKTITGAISLKDYIRFVSSIRKIK